MNKPPSKPPEALRVFLIGDEGGPPTLLTPKMLVEASATTVDAPTAPLEAAVNGFLEHAVEADKTAFTSTAELVAASRQWCDERGEWRFGARALARALRRRGALQAKSTSGYQRGWRGIRLK
jgi:hypothetical protein